MLIQDFSGGLNTRVTPNLLQLNEAQIYTNIDSSSMALKPLKGVVSTGIVIDKYFTYFNADKEFVSMAEETTFLEYRDILYISDGTSLKQRKDRQIKTVGITGPVEALEITPVLSLSNSNIVDGTTNSSNPLTSGTYEYKLVAKTHSTLSDKLLTLVIVASNSSLSTKFTVSANDFEGKEITFNYHDITGRLSDGDTVEVYRYDGDTYKLVGTAPYSTTDGVTIVDNDINLTTAPAYTEVENTYTYVYTYYDSVNGIESTPSFPSNSITCVDGALVGSIPQSADTGDIEVDIIRVYRLGGSLTSYTLVKEIDYILAPTEPFIDEAKDIDIAGNHVLDSFNNYPPQEGLKYLTEAYAMLFAAKGDKLYYSKIGVPYAWPTDYFIDFDATITGIGAMANGLLVFTEFKTYIITGNNPLSFSKFLLSSSQGCISHNSISFVDNMLVWVSTDGICTTSGGKIQVLTLDKIGKLEFNDIYSSTVLDNVYYLAYSHPLGNKIMAFDFRYKPIVRDITLNGEMIVSALDRVYQYYNGTLQRLFSSDTKLSLHWKSGILTEGQYSNYKRYKDIYIKYTGAIIFKVYIDNILVNTKELNDEGCYNLKLKDTSQGYGIEFETEGTGVVTEISYNIEPRQKA